MRTQPSAGGAANSGAPGGTGVGGYNTGQNSGAAPGGGAINSNPIAVGIELNSTNTTAVYVSVTAMENATTQQQSSMGTVKLATIFHVFLSLCTLFIFNDVFT
ncbi:unnamed protein product [Didymodactylos carnosus]|uniref:Uncharacterized protein n=1 Tax=Didymodactylos carnosus TaxID=1234261 RepID=A0A8S2RVP3_9BILA|nr:unnamed protein product [Didymodactylos carnosus]CAF4186296.1 unnamed protein product [Didymodactylos carnosus]